MQWFIYASYPHFSQGFPQKGTGVNAALHSASVKHVKRPPLLGYGSYGQRMKGLIDWVLLRWIPPDAAPEQVSYYRPRFT